MLIQNRDNVIVSRIISLLWLFLSVVPALDSYAGVYNCSQNTLVGSDLIGIEASISGGALNVDVWARKPFTSLSIGTSSQLEFFIDYDQNGDTGDARPGAIRGADLRISCDVGLVSSCSLYILPATFDGQEQKSNVVPTTILFAQDYGLRVSIPSFAFTAFDVLAFAHGRIPVFGGGTGNGDRCPEAGAFDTATGTVKVRFPAAAVDAVIDDPSGPTLLGWRFQTFGDQFRIIVGYQNPIAPFSLYFQGRLELDTDRSLLTGLVHTPFIVDSPFNEIPTWGWDVAIQIQGGSQGGSDPTPFYLDFGNQSSFIQPPRSYAFPSGFPFGEGYNDGRWHIYNNTLVLEGSLSLLDTWRWRTPGNGGTDISRVRTDGRVIGRLFTNYNTQVTDMIPKNDNAFDTGTKTSLPAIQWIPGKMVSSLDPEGDVGAAQWDLTQVDGQMDDVNLVISGTLARLDASWLQTGLVGCIDSDFDSSTGIPIANPLNSGETIGADYLIKVLPTDLYSHAGYTTVLIKADGSSESHDSWLNMNFSAPNQANSRAQSIVTVPLSAIGNPKNGVRIYLATFNAYTIYDGAIEDIAPPKPLSFINSAQKFQLTVNLLGSGTGTITSIPSGINCGSDCLEDYANGTAVTLTATPASGSTFTGWGGACSGTSICLVTLSAAVNVTANFTINQTNYSLTASKAGTGAGTIISNPPGIDCGGDCLENYASGTTVTLTATPAGGSTFTGWGGACAGTGVCSVTLSSAANVIANFTVNQTPGANTECLLNWAEGNYPALFAPSGSTTAILDVYTYRYYWATNSYLGVSSTDNHVYYMGADGKLLDEGPLSDWLPKAGCQPPPPSDCLFNWAENNYPGLFAPSGSATAVSGIYTYRYYWVTNAYLGVSSTDNHVYYMGADGRLQNEGPLSDWLTTAGCQ